MANNSKTIFHLETLITRNADAEKGYRKAGESTKRNDLSRLFFDVADERHKFLEKLEAEADAMGGSVSKSGSIKAGLHRTWMDMLTGISQYDTKDILQEIERGEEAALKDYDSALNEPLPDHLKQIVKQQREHIANDLATVQDFKERIRIH